MLEANMCFMINDLLCAQCHTIFSRSKDGQISFQLAEFKSALSANRVTQFEIMEWISFYAKIFPDLHATI